MAKRIVIVGGCTGGVSTAARLRRLDESAEIIVLEKEEVISYAGCGLPYFIGGVIKEREKLLIQTAEVMNRRYRIEVRPNSEVTKVDILKKAVSVKTKDQRKYEINYDYLVLAVGARPVIPEIPGVESSRVFTLRNLSDGEGIKEYISRNAVKKILVAGGDYIGIEVAENLAGSQIEVMLAEHGEHILSSLDGDMAAAAEKELCDNGVTLILKDGVKTFKDADSEIEAVLESGKVIRADMVVLAEGVTPDTGFLKESGISLTDEGVIVVDGHLKTSADNVYAVGAAVEIKDYVSGVKRVTTLAGPADKMGRIAADNICGLTSEYQGTLGTAIIKVFKLAAACTGLKESTLKEQNIDFRKTVVHPMAHAPYYPNGSQITIKLLFDDEGRILGSQAVGYEGVDKVMDVVSAVMRMKGTVRDLAEFEQAYAPPYSSAKSPINVAGFAAQNILAGRMDSFNPETPADIQDGNNNLVDVRTPQEYENGHMEGAVNIPVDELRSRLSELNKDDEIRVYCQVGLRGYVAARILEMSGFKVKNMTGGYKYALASGFKPGKEDKQEKKNTAETEGKSGRDSGQESGEVQIKREVDACGQSCPGPLMAVKAAADDIKSGEAVRAVATDPGFYEDIQSWCKKTDNELLSLNRDGSNITAVIRKGGGVTGKETKQGRADTDKEMPAVRDNKTIVVFSGELDKAIAAFIIANGAAAMGKKVTMFFTFWGINILRKVEKVRADKDVMEKMFGRMMPRGSKKLKLSRMNMAGIGPKMIRGLMRKKNVNSLEELIRSGMKNGIEMVACQMSMDLLGLKKEELIGGVKIGGVGYYIGETEDSNLNLFI
ncbi:MAG: DsrE/DsrF/DrsH-like family protein [Bacillota bacterium]|nr:DsrE/DsrF/DrsH-like family protein [Bacillota bacterium]